MDPTRTIAPSHSLSPFFYGDRGLGGSGGGGDMRRCSIVLSWLSQETSSNSVSGRRFKMVFTVHGFTYALGSLMVIVNSM
jgi:hypothetical protein